MRKITVCYASSKTIEVPDELIAKDEEYNDFYAVDERVLIDYVIEHSEEDFDAFTLYDEETGDYLTEL